MRALFVANPTAQSGRAAARIEETQAALKREGIDSTFLATAPEGKTVTQVRERVDAENWEAVICMGGDGTFNEVAKGILAAAKPVPMGLLPSGTANDQGKSLGISADPSALAENIAILRGGHITHLDVGELIRLEDNEAAERDLFFDSAGFGLQAEVLARRNRDRDAVAKVPVLRDLYRDQAVYAGAALQEYLASFVEPMKFAARIITDDGEAHEFDQLTDIIVKNTAVYGGAWILDRHAEPDDGRMECAPVLSRRELFSRAISDLKDLPIWEEHLEALGVANFQPFSAHAFTLHLTRPAHPHVAIQIDGEEWSRGNHLEIRVLKGALPVLTPAKWVPPWRASS
jgi:diacylglycerol kinase family enzyme